MSTDPVVRVSSRKTDHALGPGIIDLSKPREKTAGEAIDELNKTPIFTPADLNYAVPTGSVVFVQVKQAPMRSKGGVLLAEQPVPSEGVVVAAGPGDHLYSGQLVPPEWQVGDRVKFPQQMWANHIRITGADGVERVVIPMRPVDGYCAFRPPVAE